MGLKKGIEGIMFFFFFQNVFQGFERKSKGNLKWNSKDVFFLKRKEDF